MICQFNCKFFSFDFLKFYFWCLIQFINFDFSEDKSSFFVDDCVVEFFEDGIIYIIKLMNDDWVIVNLIIKWVGFGFQVGRMGKMLFGIDFKNLWGIMCYVFWLCCIVEGIISIKEGLVDFRGKVMYIMVFQGMKFYYVVVKWNFVDFQGFIYMVVVMNFIIFFFYGLIEVMIGGIVKDGEIVMVNCKSIVIYIKLKSDGENGWFEFEIIKYIWMGMIKDGKLVEVLLEGVLEKRFDRIDVMVEVFGFVKQIVLSVVGIKFYIYQVCFFVVVVVLQVKC